MFFHRTVYCHPALGDQFLDLPPGEHSLRSQQLVQSLHAAAPFLLLL
jgi:hypothetical protein